MKVACPYMGMQQKGDDEKGENYRPISIVSVPSKIFESQVNGTIIDHANGKTS
jgi:hypothetical protein